MNHVLFNEETRFSTNNDSRQIFIWREPGTRYHPFNARESDQFDECWILVWRGIVLNGSTPLHIFDLGSVTEQPYKDEVLKPHVKLFRGAIGQDLIFMGNNASTHGAYVVEDFLEEEGIYQIEWPENSPDLNLIELGLGCFKKSLCCMSTPSKHALDVKIFVYRRMRIVATEEINNLICSMRARCEAYLTKRVATFLIRHSAF
ncbi:transposable element Tcb2 transposase [Trichonephila clavipes]|nr:transposable element Tcb2 transposase [Trichonephila clavipes]